MCCWRNIWDRSVEMLEFIHHPGAVTDHVLEQSLVKKSKLLLASLLVFFLCLPDVSCICFCRFVIFVSWCFKFIIPALENVLALPPFRGDLLLRMLNVHHDWNLTVCLLASGPDWLTVCLAPFPWLLFGQTKKLRWGRVGKGGLQGRRKVHD